MKAVEANEWNFVGISLLAVISSRICLKREREEECRGRHWRRFRNESAAVGGGRDGGGWGGGGRLMTGPARDIFGLLVTRLLVIKRHRQQERRQRRRVNLLDDQRSEHNKPRKSRPLSRWWGLVTSDTLVPFLCRALFFDEWLSYVLGFLGKKRPFCA